MEHRKRSQSDANKADSHFTQSREGTCKQPFSNINVLCIALGKLLPTQNLYSGDSMLDVSRFDAAIFDLDGVITDTAPLHYQAWKETADKLNIPFNEADNEHLKGVDRMSSLDYILKLGNVSLSKDEKEALATEKNNYYRQLLQQLSSKDVLPGVKGLLESLRQQGLKIGLASASRNAPDILHSLQLTQSFDHIANPALARSKPAPDIFLFAAYGLGIHPKKCIGFEDAIAGLKAIKACSMYAVSVGDSELKPYSDLHLKNFVEVF